MSTMTRDELIDVHIRRLADYFQNHYSYDPDADPVSLVDSRRTLDSYTTELLADLLGTDDDEYTRNGNTLHVYNGRPEQWVRTYLKLTDTWNRFDGGTEYHTLSIHEAVDSLRFYPELSDEGTPEYDQQVIAITGVTIAIQYGFPATESRVDHTEARLLAYQTGGDADSTFGRLVHLANPALAGLVIRRPEQWTTIAQVITERGTDDAELIESILDGNGVFEVANGAL